MRIIKPNKSILKISISILIMSLGAFLVLSIKDGEFLWDKTRILKFRLPVVFIIGFGGIGASIGTYMIHLLTKNKATDIGTLGLNSINMLMFTIMIHQLSLSAFASISNTLLPIIYFLSSFGIVFLIYAMTYKHHVSSNKIVVLGIIISMIISAFTYLFRSNVSLSVGAAILSKSIGGIQETSSYFTQISTYIQYFLLSSIFLLTIINFGKIKIVTTDEAKAKTLGINVRKTRLNILIITALCATLSFISLGNIMLLGFMSTNIVYLFWRNKNLVQLFFVAITGVTLLLFVYLIMNSILGITIQLGVTINAIAIPYLVLVLLKGEKNGN